MRFLLLLMVSLSLVACPSGVTHDDDDRSGDDDDDATPDRTDPTQWPDEIGSDRIARVKWPSDYDGGSLPLVLQLHGYTGNGTWDWQWPRLEDHIDDTGILLVTGEGTVDPDGEPFWNATDACCDLYSSGVDDVAWLTSVIDRVIAVFPVDEERIYVTGLSNGGFMSYRMACELSPRVAAIASVAGMDFGDPEACVPAEAVSVLHIHGTADQTVPYDGWVQAGFQTPSALESVTRWAERAGCDPDDTADAGTADYIDDVAGDETSRTTWTAGCIAGHDAALWTMDNGVHVPSFTPQLGRDLLDWLLAHRR